MFQLGWHPNIFYLCALSHNNFIITMNYILLHTIISSRCLSRWTGTCAGFMECQAVKGYEWPQQQCSMFVQVQTWFSKLFMHFLTSFFLVIPPFPVFALSLGLRSSQAEVGLGKKGCLTVCQKMCLTCALFSKFILWCVWGCDVKSLTVGLAVWAEKQE